MIKITVKVDGMMCGMCEAHASNAVRNAFDVKKVESSHKKGETIIIAENDIADAEIEKVISETGYKVLSVSREPYEKKGILGMFK